MSERFYELSVPAYLQRDGDVWRFVDPPPLCLPEPQSVMCSHSFGWISRGTSTARCPWCNAKEPDLRAAAV